MSPAIRQCAVVGPFGESRVAETAVALLAALDRHGIQALAASETPLPDGLAGRMQPLPVTRLAATAQLIVAIGGDGTLLQAARLATIGGVPVLGINRGRLGFLTDVLPQEIDASIDAVVAGSCLAEKRALLRATLERPDGSRSEQLALNDVVLLRRETGRMLDFETRVNGRYVNSHSGDGFVVATATGSTAYALSCGGPIVDPALNVWVMAPICPHTMSDRPIVISGDSRVEIHLFEHGQGRADVACDGVPLGELSVNDQLRITASGRSVTLLHPPGYDYFRLLRSKLRWGRGNEPSER